jgi:hypothetical protein
MRTLGLVVCLALVSMNAAAVVKCEQAKVVSVQAMQDGRVFLRDSAENRHLLGDATSPQTALLAQVALSALGKDLYVGVAYNDGVSCTEPKEVPVRWIDVQDAKIRDRSF